MSSSASSLLSIWARGSPADQITPKASAQAGTSTEVDPFDSTNAQSIHQGHHSRRTSRVSLNNDQAGPKTPMPVSPRNLNSFPYNNQVELNVHPPSSNSPSSSSSSNHSMAASALKAIGANLSPSSDFSFTSSPIARLKKSSMTSLIGTSRISPLQASSSHQGLKSDHPKSAQPRSPVSSNPSQSSEPPCLPQPAGQPSQPKTPSALPLTAALPKNPLALPPKGLLSVKIISASSLRCATSYSRPYVVAQFDNNEFVSREPISEEEDESKGVVTNGASSGGIITPREIDSGYPQRIPQTDDRNFCLSGQNPIWKQEVDFDVTQHQPQQSARQTLHVSVYDRSIGDFQHNPDCSVSSHAPVPLSSTSSTQLSMISGVEGLELFMGETEIELDFEQLLKRGPGWYDQSYKLTMKNVDSVSTIDAGEIRIQLKYRELKSKKSLDVSDFEFLKMIGKGTFGRVFQVRKKDTKRIYAMKVLSKKEVIDKKEVQHTIGERNILQQSNQCPFLLGLKFSFQSPGELFLVMDYKSGGELFHHLQKEGRFTEERARFYTAEIVLALEHLHRYNIIYRDLKPENILLDATGHIVLCDFGLSKPNLSSDELTSTFCGTTEYLAPEVLLDDHGYSKLVDFWSLGVLMFEMCCGWSPFYAEDNQQMYKNICFGKIKFPRGVIGDEGKQFVKGLLNRNPKHRLGAQNDAEDLKRHAFFASIDWEKLENRQIIPTFKPYIDSDDSVANFDKEFTQLNIEEQLPMTLRGALGEGDLFDENDRSADWVKQASYVTPSGFNHHRSGGSIHQNKKPLIPSKPVALTKAPGSLQEENLQDHFLGFSYHGESEIHMANSSKFGFSKLE